MAETQTPPGLSPGGVRGYPLPEEREMCSLSGSSALQDLMQGPGAAKSNQPVT